MKPCCSNVRTISIGIRFFPRRGVRVFRPAPVIGVSDIQIDGGTIHASIVRLSRRPRGNCRCRPSDQKLHELCRQLVERTRHRRKRFIDAVHCRDGDPPAAVRRQPFDSSEFRRDFVLAAMAIMATNSGSRPHSAGIDILRRRLWHTSRRIRNVEHVVDVWVLDEVVEGFICSVIGIGKRVPFFKITLSSSARAIQSG